MTNFFQDLKDLTLARVKNTLLLSFIISWSIINYSIVLKLIFSKVTIEDKIQYLNNAVFEWNKDLIFPILIVLAYEFLFPYLNLLITKIKDKTISKWIKEHKNNNMKDHYKGQIEVEKEKLNLKYIEKNIELELREKEQEIEQNILRTKEQQLEVMKRMSDAETENTNQIDNTEKNSDWEDAEIITKENNLLITDTDTKLPELEEKLLKGFAGVSSEDGRHIRELYNDPTLEGHIDEKRMFIEDLTEKKYLEYTGETASGHRYKLTNKGRKYLYNNDLLNGVK